MAESIALDWLPRKWCFECAAPHDPHRRHAILVRMLPATVHEIREEYSHLWGPACEDDNGARMLYRDLHAVGAQRQRGGVWAVRRMA